MGLSNRLFIATESGRLVKISTARLQRMRKGERFPEYAGQELKMVSVVVEVDRRRILEVVHVGLYRTRLDANGRLDVETALREAINRVPWRQRPPTTEETIARLQKDASYFWEPTESEWNQAADLLGVPKEDLKARWRLPGQ